MKVAVIDYGMGNLGSVCRAVAEVGAVPVIADSPAQALQADRMILPGVGSFADGMAHLRAAGWVDALRDAVLSDGKPLLGICLGMQLLADAGDEGGAGESVPGLGLIPGSIHRLDVLGCDLRIPHVGWNAIQPTENAHPILAGFVSQTDCYFVHSYAFRAASRSHVLACADYGFELTAIVASGAATGVQFHPEKSSKAGLRLLRNFIESPIC